MYSKLAVVAVVLVAAAGVFADDFANNCNIQKKICLNGGVCHENVGVLSPDAGSRSGWKDPFCVCQAPYGGNDCSRTIRECKDNPCQNGGTCAPASCTGSHDSESYDCFTCTCPKGWTGAPSYALGSNPGGVCDWKQLLQDCTNNGCANGGTCQNVAVPASGMTPAGYGYKCQCTTGWLGGQTTRDPTNFFNANNLAYNCTVPDCTTSDGACQNGGTCVGGFCNCGAYAGYRCEKPRFCDNPNACPAGYTCQNTVSGMGTCTAPAFCSVNTCANGGTCQAGACTCTTGFNGLTCNATTFCSSSPCQNGATCMDDATVAGGDGHCVCPPNTGNPAYIKHWTGKFCETPMNGCARDGVGCAPASSGCSTAKAFTDYRAPFSPVSTCGCDGATAGGLVFFDCRCNSTTLSKCPGTSGGLKGANADMVCQNGGSCYETAEGAQCLCRQGFWGDSCQNYDNPCQNSPCENGGQCYITGEMNTMASGFGLAADDRTWGWRCKCKWPYYGKNCEKVAPVATMDAKDPVVCGASNSPCQNGGTCSANTYDSANGGFFYTNPWTGQDVEAEPWMCTCPTSGNRNPSTGSIYTGMMCEQLVEECGPDSCQNGGYCTNNGVAGGFSCTCPCGYAGDRCEFPATNINTNSVAQLANDGAGGVGYRLEFCSRSPCQNGGSCFHSTNGQGFLCQCKSGWAGSYCQYQVRSAAAGLVPSLVAVVAAVAVAFALKH